MANKIIVYVGDQLYSSGENDEDTVSFANISREQNLREPQSEAPTVDAHQCANDVNSDNNERRRLGDIEIYNSQRSDKK